ncbi:MAG: hypothetical protein A3J67_00250 [Parcubacteria group bacterium RIFCSPHIGHO2_02_FULL_48_10b]|nr:MAG: hypothetical protein A3J67_00250 [Parcubacteria group bacterium RIFCSPHIGHO2_02_FULL_48_10b]
MKNPRVSIVLATYNRAHFLGAAIQSVQKQTFQDWELIVSDDASTDNTLEIVKEIQENEPRIRYRKNEKNLGISRNYNAAIRAARGEYIAMIDDDDPWVGSEKLSRQVSFFEENGDYVGVGGGMIVVDRSGKELFRYFKPETDGQIRKSMFFSNPMANSATLFRKNAALQAGLYDEEIEHGADRDFWLRMGRIGKLYNFPDHFAYYTISGQNSLFKSQRIVLRCVIRFLRKYRQYYPRYSYGIIFTYGVYLYSSLPQWFHAFTDVPLFFVKRLVFDRIRKR